MPWAGSLKQHQVGFSQVLLHVLLHVKSQGFGTKIEANGRVVRQPHATIPGVYVQGMDASEFINRTLSGFQFFRAANMKELVSWFTTKTDNHFELLTTAKFQECDFVPKRLL